MDIYITKGADVEPCNDRRCPTRYPDRGIGPWSILPLELPISGIEALQVGIVGTFLDIVTRELTL